MTKPYRFNINPEKPHFEIVVGNDTVIIEPIDAKNGCSFLAENNSILYSSLWNGADLRYDFTDKEIKETIICRSHMAQHKFKFMIKWEGYSIQEDDVLKCFNNNNEFLYLIKKPFIITANYKNIYDSKHIYYSFDPSTNIYEIVVQKNSFEASDYPLIIDPTFSFNIESDVANHIMSNGINRKSLTLIGSDESGTVKDLSNTETDDDGKVIINGSDVVTFHKNVIAQIDTLSNVGSETVSSIRISGKNKTTIYSGNEIESEAANFTLTPTTLNALVNSGITYNFSLTITTTSNVSVSTVTRLLKNTSTPILDQTFGSISQPQLSSSSKSINKYTIKYVAPPNKPSKQSYCILECAMSITTKSNGKDIVTTKSLYSYINLNENIITDPFDFREYSSKTDFINGDFYAPTKNRGLIVFDTSLGVIATIDVNNGLSDMDVYCGGRIGTPYDSPSNGIIVCTTNGMYYFTSNPYSEPASYTKVSKFSEKKIIDFVMSGNHIFFLDLDGSIYRINYKCLLNLISINSSSDLIDSIFETHQPFYLEEGATISPYAPSKKGLPTNLLAISVNSDYPTKTLSQTYFGGEQEKWHGISVLYTENKTNKKMITTIVYAKPSDTSTGSVAEKDYETWYNKVLFSSYVDEVGGAPHKLYKIAKDDCIDMAFEWEPNSSLVSDDENYNKIIIKAPAIKYTNTRIVVGAVMEDGLKTDQILSKIKPLNTYYLCPRNISILSVEEMGPFYDPITGEVVV